MYKEIYMNVEESSVNSLCNFMIEVVKKLENLSPRRGHRAEKAGDVIVDILSREGVSLEVIKMPVTVPRPRIVKAEGVPSGVDMEPNCFEGGVVDGSVIVSSLAVREDFNLPNINYSPYSDEVSLATFYPRASVAVSRKSLPLIAGREVRITVEVEREGYLDRIIVVGDTESPRTIVATHYDSVLNGAVDNASGVAVVLAALAR
ncbi:MAG: M28 family metallopeptidase [Desulfurococcales archaeon]|nr:M28 family metallopeptidase [Desulfurococcales archaeon]